MKIVLLESLAVSDAVLASYAKKLEEAGHSFTAYEKNTDPAVMIERAKDADVIMIANMPLPGEVIRACKNLKFIDVAFTGVDHVDIAAAKECGVAVSNAAGYSNEAVAELTICMMLACLRNVPQVVERARAGKTKDGLVGRELRGKTVGIVGVGAIGKQVAALLHAFGCKLIGYEPNLAAHTVEYVEYMELDEVMAKADIVTVHCPLMDSTRGLISRERIGLMKKRGILINCARGPIVDMQALADALNAGQIEAAGVDVYEVEPPLPTEHPLLHSKNTIPTPHIAFASDESMEARAEIVFHSLDCFIAGEQINKII